MAEVNKKPNIFVRMGTGLSRWFREMKSELKKVVWPSGKQLVNNTVVVLSQDKRYGRNSKMVCCAYLFRL